MSYAAVTASVASRQTTARNIADSAVTWLQPRSNTCKDAAIVRDHVTLRETFGFQLQTADQWRRVYPANGQLFFNFVIFAYI